MRFALRHFFNLLVPGTIYVNANHSDSKGTLLSCEVKSKSVLEDNRLDAALKHLLEKMQDKILGPLNLVKPIE